MNSNFFNPMQIFNKQKDLLKNAETETDSQAESIFLRPKRDSKYELKLLWLPSNVRRMPWVEQHTHDFWYTKTDDDGTEHRRLKQVICPTSPYDMDKKGYDSCPICVRLKEAWSKKDSSPAERSIYDNFKRKFTGFIPVYVVNSSNPDIIGKIKILCYGKNVKNFFSDNIFGDGGEENLGLDAFIYYDPENEELHSGSYNLLMNVTTKQINLDGKQLNVGEYSLKFGRKKTEDGPDNGEWNLDKFLNLDEEIGFTKSAMIKSDADKLVQFKLEMIDGVEPETNDDQFAEDTIEKLSAGLNNKKDAVELPKKSIDEDEPFDEPEQKKSETKSKKNDDIDLDEMFKDEEETPKKQAAKPAKKSSDDDFDLDAMLAELDK